MRFWRVLGWLVLAGLVIPAIGLTAVRAFQPDSGLAVRATSFAPLALPLYAAALLLLLAKTARPGNGRRLPWLVAAVGALVGLAVHAWWISPAFVGPNPPPAAESEKFTVMTANLLKGEADVTGVVEAVARQDVDVLVVEEVTPGAVRQMESAGLASALPNSAGAAANGVTGTMVFTSGEISSEKPIDTYFGGTALTITLDQGEVRLLAVHPQPPVGTAEGWRDDLGVVADAVRAEESVDLVVGDFNATPDHKPFQEITDLDLHSAAERANEGWQPTWPANGNRTVIGVPLPRLVQIDHVLVGNRIGVLDTERIGIDESDHSALVANLALR